MSWLSDATGVNWDSGLRVADAAIHAINPSTSYEGSDVEDENKRNAEAAEAETKAKLAAAKRLLAESEVDLESSTYKDMFSALSAMENTGNYSQGGLTLAGFTDSLNAATGKFKGLRQLGVDRQKSRAGYTSTLAGGKRYEQLLTKESVGIQQEIGAKKKDTLLTADTLMATNKKAGI